MTFVFNYACLLSSRALVKDLLTQDMVDDYDPALMFTIPRLAIVSGLLFYPYMSPLSLDQNATNMSDMFRPFRVSKNDRPYYAMGCKSNKTNRSYRFLFSRC